MGLADADESSGCLLFLCWELSTRYENVCDRSVSHGVASSRTSSLLKPSP